MDNGRLLAAGILHVHRLAYHSAVPRVRHLDRHTASSENLSETSESPLFVQNVKLNKKIYFSGFLIVPQAEAFRNLYNGKGECIVQNYREPHWIHERKIFYAIED